MRTRSFALIALMAFRATGFAQTNWTLKKDAEGIKVYTSAAAGSNVKAIKVACELEATAPQLVALLLDAKAHEQWVYGTKRSYEVKRISPDHQVYYSEISMPWPLANREVVVDLKITRQTGHIFMVQATAVEGYVGANGDKVRVSFSDVAWTITPVSNDKLKIEYRAQADPGGSVPAWVSNMFITKGPFETFKRLRQIVKQPKYQTAVANFVSG